MEGWAGRLYILVFSLRNLKKILRSLSPMVSSLFPLDSSIVLKRLKKYLDAELEPELPPHSQFFSTPKTIRHGLQLGEALKKKIDPLLSSPTWMHFGSYQGGVEAILKVANK